MGLGFPRGVRARLSETHGRTRCRSKELRATANARLAVTRIENSSQVSTIRRTFCILFHETLAKSVGLREDSVVLWCISTIRVDIFNTNHTHLQLRSRLDCLSNRPGEVALLGARDARNLVRGQHRFQFADSHRLVWQRVIKFRACFRCR